MTQNYDEKWWQTFNLRNKNLRACMLRATFYIGLTNDQIVIFISRIKAHEVLHKYKKKKIKLFRRAQGNTTYKLTINS